MSHLNLRSSAGVARAFFLAPPVIFELLSNS